MNRTIKEGYYQQDYYGYSQHPGVYTNNYWSSPNYYFLNQDGTYYNGQVPYSPSYMLYNSYSGINSSTQYQNYTQVNQNKENLVKHKIHHRQIGKHLKQVDHKEKKHILPPKGIGNPWWKVHKDKTVIHSTPVNKTANHNVLQACQPDRTSNSTTISPKRQNSLIVIKKEDAIIDNQPKSEQLLKKLYFAKTQQKAPTTVCQQRREVPTSTCTKSVQIEDKQKTPADNDQKAGNIEKPAVREANNKSVQIIGTIKKITGKKINNQCKEILSKFVLQETSHEIDNQVRPPSDKIQYHELGKNLTKTLQFIMNEIHSIDATRNYLALKLSPRQMRDIAILIANELDNLKVSGKIWAYICRVVITTLNENFKTYFSKSESHKKNGGDNESNSWMWLVEVANNFE